MVKYIKPIVMSILLLNNNVHYYLKIVLKLL